MRCNRLTPSALLSFILGLGACQDQEPSFPLAPTSDSPAMSRARDPIPGQYIVVFQGDIQDARAVARELAGKHAGKLTHSYHRALKGMSIQLSDVAATALSRNPAVKYVEQDQTVRTVGELIVQAGATAGLDRIDQRSLPLNGTYGYTADGTGVHAYILDTGIHQDHNDFGGRAVTGFDVVTSGGSAGDCNGHGTHVAGTVGGTIYGVAKKVKLYAVRVLDCSGSGSLSGVIAGIDWVSANRILPAVANLSLGTGFSAALNEAVSNSIASGITYVVAAGNSASSACNASPSSTPDAITVAASTMNDGFANFSNFGSCVDIAAPGVGITSAWIGSATATNKSDGTSMASPHVAGAAALFLSANLNGTPAQVAAAITTGATSGILTAVPAGTVNRLLHTAGGSGSGWAVRSPLPSARQNLAVGTAGGLLYAMGGSNGAGTALTTVHAYNPNTNSWSSKASLPAARHSGNGAATISGIIYISGGLDGARVLTRTLYAYNSGNNTWSARASMPVPGGCGGSAVISGKLYVFSGCTRSSSGVQVAAGLLHRYDPSTNLWTTLRTAPAVHWQPAVGVMGGKLYVVGGSNSSGVATGRLDVYDPATNTWSTRSSMPTTRSAMGGAVVAGKLYAVGGRNGANILSTVEVYDRASGTWAASAAMPTARSNLGAAVLNNLLYLVGGGTATTVLANNERLAP